MRALFVILAAGSAVWISALVAIFGGAPILVPTWAHALGALSLFGLSVFVGLMRSPLVERRLGVGDQSLAYRAISLIVTGACLGTWMATWVFGASALCIGRRRLSCEPQVEIGLPAMAIAFTALGILWLYAKIAPRIERQGQSKRFAKMRPEELSQLQNRKRHR